jgi:hypothetical protein
MDVPYQMGNPQSKNGYFSSTFQDMFGGSFNQPQNRSY